MKKVYELRRGDELMIGKVEETYARKDGTWCVTLQQKDGKLRQILVDFWTEFKNVVEV